jgi:glycosyltransferase involved in cell wall biosynthesis
VSQRSRSLRRSIALARQLASYATVASRHLRDDPVNAAVLAARAAPVPLAHGAGRLLAAGGRSAPSVRTIAAFAAGQHESAQRLLDEAVAQLLDNPGHDADVARTSRRARRLVSLAVALDRPRTARTALAAVDSRDAGRPRLEALTLWREGSFTAAVGLLDTALDNGGVGAHRAATARTRDRIAAELRALDADWRPVPAPAHARVQALPGRVLHLVTNSLPYTSAGYTVRTHSILRSQREAGLDPHAVTRLGFPLAQGIVGAPPLEHVDGVPYHRLLPRSLPRGLDNQLAVNVHAASQLVRSLRPAVLHAATNHLNGQIALALREAHEIPVVYEVRGFLEETWRSRHAGYGQDTERYLLARTLETSCMRAADLVVTLAEVMKADIVARGVPPERVVVAPNAVDADFLTPPPDPAPLRRELGIGPDEVAIGLVSSFVPYEGIDTLIRATALLRDRRAPVRLLLVGDGSDASRLAGLVDELGLRAVATMTGRVPYSEVRRYHAALDVFVVPRTDDRVCQLVTPLKPLEAMATGKPVVASRVAALAEIVAEGVTGFLAPPGDAAGLADVLEPLLYDPARRRVLGQAAREWVAGHRTWARVAQTYVESYARLGVERAAELPSVP